MRMIRILQALCLAASLNAQSWVGLPTWAYSAAVRSAQDPIPKDADAWVILDRREVTYLGDGEVRIHQYYLARVITDAGRLEGSFRTQVLGGRSVKIKKLKGWISRPDESSEKLDLDKALITSGVIDQALSDDRLVSATFPRVARDSFVAWEWEEVERHPIGPHYSTFVLDSNPIHTLEIEIGKGSLFNGQKDTQILVAFRHFSPLMEEPQWREGAVLSFNNVPAKPKGEGATPWAVNGLPQIRVRYLDPHLKDVPSWASWDDMAKWQAEIFADKASQAPDLKLPSLQGLEALKALWKWMGDGVTYRQVYLSPERGWVPNSAEEVFRTRYGDCKDLSCFVMAQAHRIGYDAFPAMARIVEGRLEEGDAPFPSFNHVITAIKLPESLGLPCEIETKQGRFLLFDPTDKATPLGWLGGQHQGRRVLICLPEGGAWVQVPDAGVLPQRIHLVSSGKLLPDGTLDLQVTLTEEGDAWRLRSLAQMKGASKIVESLKQDRLRGLPAAGRLELVSLANVLELDRPMEIALHLQIPEGLKREGGEIRIDPHFLAAEVPSLIQGVGRPRLLPVVQEDQIELQFHLELALPFHLAPVLDHVDSSSPLREVHWKAATSGSPSGTLLKIDLASQRKTYLSPLGKAEEGVNAWKRDRTFMKNLLADGFSFKLLP